MVRHALHLIQEAVAAAAAAAADPLPRHAWTIGGHHRRLWALAYCYDIDELEREINPSHREFSWVFHYEQSRRTVLGPYSRRLDALYRFSDGTVMAAGDTPGYVEITPDGFSDVSIASVDGSSTCFWGPSDDHIFATGCASPFVFYRRHGKWRELALPGGAEGVRCVHGLAEDDVYFVGDAGQVHHFDGHRLARLELPVDTWVLNGVARLDDERVVVSGHGGTLLLGNRAGWQQVDAHTHEPLLAIATLEQRRSLLHVRRARHHPHLQRRALGH